MHHYTQKLSAKVIKCSLYPVQASKWPVSSQNTFCERHIHTSNSYLGVAQLLSDQWTKCCVLLGCRRLLTDLACQCTHLICRHAYKTEHPASRLGAFPLTDAQKPTPLSVSSLLAYALQYVAQ